MAPPSFLPLSGIRILTFENFGAGPFGSMYLADLGAEVIKIENRDQGGDATRSMGPYFLGKDDSHFFQTFNLNKKSLTLNLKTREGQEIFKKLAATADAVINPTNSASRTTHSRRATARSFAHICPRTAATTSGAAGRDTTI
jgi:crotonobetainyl-CoA:carnitine CoA-transferase CaiB-like acyl-CoA transferase